MTLFKGSCHVKLIIDFLFLSQFYSRPFKFIPAEFKARSGKIFWTREETVFLYCVFFLCASHRPWDLAHRNKKRYLFGGVKGVFLCFCAQKKNTCGHPLKPCPKWDFLFFYLLYHTVRLTSTGNPVPGKQEFRLAPSETIVGQVKK